LCATHCRAGVSVDRNVAIGQAPTFPVDENILGFDVTVDNSIIVQVRQPEQRIQEHAPHFWPFGPLIAVNPLVE
jgi:hypothetical protein